jgi:hypothetical protein
MASPEPAPLLGQFRVSRDDSLRRLAGTLRRAGGEGLNASIVPSLRQATVVSSDGGSPPTCTITFDGGATFTPGVRYLASYTPAAGNVVEVLGRPGNPIILGTLA